MEERARGKARVIYNKGEREEGWDESRWRGEQTGEEKQKG